MIKKHGFEVILPPYDDDILYVVDLNPQLDKDGWYIPIEERK